MFYALCIFFKGLTTPFLPHEVLFYVGIWYGAGIRERGYEVVGICFRNSHHFFVCVIFVPLSPLYSPSVCDIHEHILGQKHFTSPLLFQ